MKQIQRPSSVYWIDDKLYLNITNKCSNKCKFCIKNFRRGLSGFKLELSKDPTISQVIDELKEVLNTKNWSEVVFCGFGEPTEKLDLLLEVTKWIKRHYGKPVLLRVNTNGQGYLLNPGKNVVKELKKAGINKVSVSLNASNKEVYKSICQPKLDNAYNAALNFIHKSKKELEVEVTAVATTEVNIKKIAEIAGKLGVKFRRRVYVPYFS
jgi:TatD family-associated radical SAM protein